MTAFESWLPVPGFEDAYEVSDLGRVRTKDRVDSLGRPLTGQLRRTPVWRGAGCRYRSVGLSKGGRKTTRSVHSLVAEAFHGPRPPGAVVRHLDGDALNNLATNLAWGTPLENIQDALAHGRNEAANRTHCPLRHPLAGDNLVRASLRRGHRSCRACHQTHAFIRNHPEVDFKAESDRRLSVLVGGTHH